MQKKRVLLIINPISGQNNKRVAAVDLINKLSSGDFDFEVRTTRCQGDATTIVKEIGERFDMIICCGGDGTLNETVNGLLKIDKRIPIGYVPCGSTNDLASTLGIPVGVTEASNLILNGNTNTYDVGTFNGRGFNYVASFGAATEIAYETPQLLKNMFGHNAYMINGLVFRLIPMLVKFKPAHMRIEYDGGEIEDDFYFGSVSNSTSVAGLFKLDDIKLNDGEFELLLVRGLKKNTDCFKILDKIIHKEYDGDKIILVKTKSVKITSDREVSWTLDGEYGGSPKDAKIEIIHDAFDIYSDNDDLFLKK